MYTSAIALAALTGQAVQSASLPSQSIELNKGEQLTTLFIKKKLGGEAAQQSYLQGAFKLAGNNGIREVAVLPVVRTIVGENQPEAIALYAWKNKSIIEKVRNNPHYVSSLKPLQKLGWDELSYSDASIAEGLKHQLSPEKFYTLGQVWLKDTKSYLQYFEGTKSLREQLGAKVIFKYQPHTYSTLQQENKVPNYSIMIEWQNENNIKEYTQSEKFKEYSALLEKDIDKIDWYQVAVLTDNNNPY